MEFKVPQNVQREDKILGPLTIKGFIICGAGFAAMYIAYLIFDDSVYPFVDLIILLFTILFTFVRIHDMTFFQYLLAMTLFHFRPQRRVWVQHAANFPLEQLVTAKIDGGEKKKDEKKKKDAPSVEELASMLDQKEL